MPLRDPNPTDWPAAQRNFRELAKLVAELRRDINNHESASTNVHGIGDTADLVTVSDWTPIGSGGSSYASGWSGDSSIGLGGELAFRVVGGCLHLLGGARGGVGNGLICTLPVTGYEASFYVPDPFIQNWQINTYALNDDGEITFGPQGPPTTDLIVYFNHVIPLRSP